MAKKKEMWNGGETNKYNKMWRESEDYYDEIDSETTFRDELKETFPYRVIRVERAEADDIIGALCHEHGVLGFMPGYAERILILSGDKDFSQLRKYANVEQYSPITKKWIRVNNPERYLREHIMRGDRGDGIPNFLSSDACLVNGERQNFKIRYLLFIKINTFKVYSF